MTHTFKNLVLTTEAADLNLTAAPSGVDTTVNVTSCGMSASSGPGSYVSVAFLMAGIFLARFGKLAAYVPHVFCFCGGRGLAELFVSSSCVLSIQDQCLLISKCKTDISFSLPLSPHPVVNAHNCIFKESNNSALVKGIEMSHDYMRSHDSKPQ